MKTGTLQHSRFIINALGALQEHLTLIINQPLVNETD